jgi:hypothetical protein
MQTCLIADKMDNKAQSLEDILHYLGPTTNVSFEPFQPEPQQPAKALLPLSFPSKPYLFDYFSLFFTHDLLRTIPTNKNRYATIGKLQVPQERGRKWTNMLVKELYVFLGTIIYMGIRQEPQVEMYWKTDYDKGLLHSILHHIYLCRFEQIKRYCCILN